MTACWILLKVRNISDKVEEKIKTYMFSSFSKNSAVYDSVENYVGVWQDTICNIIWHVLCMMDNWGYKWSECVRFSASGYMNAPQCSLKRHTACLAVFYIHFHYSTRSTVAIFSSGNLLTRWKKVSKLTNIIRKMEYNLMNERTGKSGWQN